ncbi:MAG: OmpA family protein [Candidatus Cyclobacteriaceae bacterium M2_1C_046]
MRALLHVIFFIFCVSHIAVGQDLERTLYRANTYYSIKNYSSALPLYLEAIEEGSKDPAVHYKTGNSYYHALQINEQIKGIPFYEFAIKNINGEIPSEAYKEVGELYLKNEQIDKAIAAFTTYKSTLNNEPKKIEDIEKQLKTARTALAMISMARDADVINMGNIINSSYTEYNPVVSADEGIMAFTALRPNTGKGRSAEDFVEEIMITYNSSGNWSEPKSIPINSQYNIGTAGLSADGQRMIIFIGGANNSGNLYFIDKSGENWSNPTVLNDKVNSRHMETTASITPDGKTIYFASNRPGGFGGYDIYRIKMQENNTWEDPENLGAKINTAANEDAPFIHPDQWTLFFTSDGHNTMGGRDIYVTRLFNNEWTSPENMGYPINTTANDNYFTLTADGRKGYFSSDRKGGFGGQDIYSINMPEEEANIPLTMIKGQILDGETGKALPTKIYMVDNESGKKLDFVYQPDPETGSYLIILPPSKNYDMIIESEGYLPYTLNINIPGQTYFYELYQKIMLKTIKQFDVVVGQEVEVKNAFYDTHQEAKTNLRKTHEAALVKNDDIDVYEMMNDLISAGDEAGIEYLVDLIQMSTPIEDVDFENSEGVELANRIYYYDESDESKFEKKEVEGKTIFSLPTFYVTEEAEKQRNAKSSVEKSYDLALLEKNEKIFFEAGKSELKEEYEDDLKEILQVLQDHPELGVKISGYSSSEGDRDFNIKLSNERAVAVLNYINQRGIVRRRIIAVGQGESKDESVSAEKSRRVELQVVDLGEYERKDHGTN